MSAGGDKNEAKTARNGVIVICGPTASSKTKFAVSLAEKLHTEVISADCMLVYRDLNIGTAKPTKEEMRGVKHYLIDVASPHEKFSVGDYRALALPIIDRLQKEGKTPIICGGTGFYIDSLLYNSAFGSVGANEEIREKYEAVLKEYGKEEGAKRLHARLYEVDPESAAILHENDTKRVIRALEIFEQTGKKKSEQADTKTPRCPFKAFCVDYPRDRLYERINARVDKMFEDGLENEVHALLKDGVRKDSQCMQGIGYKEFVEGEEAGESAEEIKEKIKQHTRNYAKRQITYFRRMPNLTKIVPEQIENDENLDFMAEYLTDLM